FLFWRDLARFGAIERDLTRLNSSFGDRKAAEKALPDSLEATCKATRHGRRGLDGPRGASDGTGSGGLKAEGKWAHCAVSRMGEAAGIRTPGTGGGRWRCHGEKMTGLLSLSTAGRLFHRSP